MGRGGGAAVLLFALGMCLLCGGGGGAAEPFVSVAGDPGMRRDGLRVAFEGWNFCNEVGEEAPGMGSPRAAECFDLAGDGADRHCSPIEVFLVRKTGSQPPSATGFRWVFAAQGDGGG